MPVFRHMRQAQAAHLVGRRGVSRVISRPSTVSLPELGARIPEKHLQQLALPIARDAGDADNLAGAQGEPDIVEALFTPSRRSASDALRSRPRPGRRRRISPAPRPALAHLAPDHQFGQFLAVGLGGSALRHHFALAHHGDGIGHRHDLAQLVGDRDDGDAAGFQRRQDAEQLIGLLRRQDAGGLVRDQDLAMAIERLQDFDPLLFPTGNSPVVASGSTLRP